MITELTAYPAQLKARAIKKTEEAKLVKTAYEQGIKAGVAIAYNLISDELAFLFLRNSIRDNNKVECDNSCVINSIVGGDHAYCECACHAGTLPAIPPSRERRQLTHDELADGWTEISNSRI